MRAATLHSLTVLALLAFPAQAMNHSVRVQQACPHIAPLHDEFDKLDAGGTEEQFFADMDQLIKDEIGRASCRERV